MMDFNINISNAPFEGFLMCVKEYVEVISANDAASVENFYDLTILVAGDDHFVSKRVYLISGYKAVALGYFMAGGCYTV